jgi:hypothetical protein
MLRASFFAGSTKDTFGQVEFERSCFQGLRGTLGNALITVGETTLRIEFRSASILLWQGLDGGEILSAVALFYPVFQ